MTWGVEPISLGSLFGIGRISRPSLGILAEGIRLSKNMSGMWKKGYLLGRDPNGLEGDG